MRFDLSPFRSAAKPSSGSHSRRSQDRLRGRPQDRLQGRKHARRNASRRRCLIESLEGRRLLAAGDIAFVSFADSGIVGGVHYQDEDILAVDRTTGEWSMYFDGSKVGVGSTDLEAIQVLPDGDILISLDRAIEIPSLGNVLDSDILRFTPTGHGSRTAGSFSYFLDGSDVGLPSITGDIRGLTFTPDGRLVISTFGASPQGQTAQREDMLVLNDAVFGEDTSGNWELYFDGSDVGLAGNYNFGSFIDDDGTIFIATRFPFSLDGVSGQKSDVAACDPVSLGANTACDWSLGFDGSEYGLSDNMNVDAIQFGAFTGEEVFDQGRIYMSTVNNVSISTLRFANEDIFYQERRTAAWHHYFDGSDLGITGDLDAFHLLDDESVLMSFRQTVSVPGIGSVSGEDIVRFLPTSTGETTAGTFEMHFDGSDVGLSQSAEDIDAIALDSDGNLLISVRSVFNAGGVTGSDKDLFRFDATELGPNTAGSWQLYFDGEDVGLTTSTEDIEATWINPATGDIHFSTVSGVVTDGASGFRSDVLACHPTSLGATTACDMSLYYEGAAEGMIQGIDGLHITGATAPVEEADLAVALSELTDPVLVGDPLTYTLAVTNNGSLSAEDVMLRHTLPTGVTFVSATAAHTIADGVVNFALGSLNPSNVESIEVVVTTASAGELTSTVTVTTTTAESRLSDNFDSETTLVTAPQADLTLSISDDADPVSVGDTLTYTLTVHNDGPEVAQNSVLVSTLPANATYVTSSDSGQPNGGTVTHNLGALASGGTTSVTVTVATTTAGGLGFDATVSSDTSDINAANNTASESTSVLGPPPENDILFASFLGTGAVGGVSYFDEDILAYDTASGEWSLYFDGSQLGLSAADVNAFHVRDDGSILLSFDGAVTIPDLGRIDDSDIVLFTPTAHGGSTAGSFAWYVDGSDVGLAAGGGDVDAISLTEDGRLVISVASTQTLSGQSVRSEDLLVLNDASFGENTSGQWAVYLDGSDIGTTNYNVSSASLDAASGSTYMTLSARFNVNGLIGDANDILRYDGSTLTNDLDGSSLGVAASQSFDGIQFGSLSGNEVFPQDLIYYSQLNNSSTNGLAVADEDILIYDTSRGVRSIFFDGSDVGITTDVNAFWIEDDGSVLMSFNANTTVPGIGAVVSRDIVRFLPSSTGEDTAGTFEWYVDGSDIDLTTYYEDIDSISFAPDGGLVISTSGSFAVGGISGRDADLLKFNATQLGSETIGTWELYLDGSDIELTTSAEDIAALSIDAETGELLWTPLGTMSAGGITATRADIVSCEPITLGENTDCLLSLRFDGSDFGLTQAMDALQVQRIPVAAQASSRLVLPTLGVPEAEFPVSNDRVDGGFSVQSTVSPGDAVKIVDVDFGGMTGPVAGSISPTVEVPSANTDDGSSDDAEEAARLVDESLSHLDFLSELESPL